MTQYELQLVVVFKLISVVIFGSLYGFGGIDNLWLRRILAPIFLILAIVGLSLWTSTFSYWYLLYAPLLFGSLTLGYGANETKIKLFKRSYCGLAYAVAALPIAIVTGSWVLFALHTLVCLSFSVVLGVLNPVKTWGEESLIGTGITLIPMFMY